MRAVIQRVKRAVVRVDQVAVGACESGLLIFLGVETGDTEADADWLAGRIAKTRIFEDADGRMNHSLSEVSGEALVISQFTLLGSLKKGNRPSFNRAADPALAVPLYEQFQRALSDAIGRTVASGRFGADMQIEAHNDGPITLILDSRERDF